MSKDGSGALDMEEGARNSRRDLVCHWGHYLPDNKTGANASGS
jgi:hypothetical protein